MFFLCTKSQLISILCQIAAKKGWICIFRQDYRIRDGIYKRLHPFQRGEEWVKEYYIVHRRPRIS
ncbi:hypothetical protein HMPREF0322_05158 [Desulfitobacterium hafniense DP7]|uniref:Uncharacterized protein n=1 Tax=Desulfitobacterium hafniense DP7 TaxID=537010 RepID=G9XVX5_DESHA|nr:hypothetical protein HMPREF0322_05158 [Desulfitobacterium hafniense DP7]